MTSVIDRKVIVNFTIRKFMEIPPNHQKAVFRSINHPKMVGRIAGEEYLYLLFLYNALELIGELGIKHKAEILALPCRIGEIDEILSLYFRENLKPTRKKDRPYRIKFIV